MSKIQDYREETELSFDNVFITEKENVDLVNNPTSQTKLSTIGQFLWDNQYKTLTELKYTLLDFEAANWSDTAPYTQVLNCPELQSIYMPLIDISLSDSLNSSGITYEQQLESYSYVHQIKITENGKITATCLNNKPSYNFQIKLLYNTNIQGNGDCFLAGRTLK